MSEETMERASAEFQFEYVTSIVSLRDADGIGVHVVNDSGSNEVTQVVIYKNSGAGATVVADSGPATLTPTWAWSLGYTVSSPGEYWLRIRATSEALVPKASFERVEGAVWKPLVSYRPGDFAVFSLTRRRLW